MLSDSTTTTPFSFFRQDDCYFTLSSLNHQNDRHNNGNDQIPLLHSSTADSPPQSPGSTELVYSPPTPTSPVINPTNPLLAHRLPPAEAALAAMPSPAPSSSTTSSLLQRQTAAAHGSSHQSSSRPRPYPVQNVLHVTSDDSGSASSSSESESSSSSTLPSASSSSNSGSSYYSRHSHSSSLDGARCSRCQRTPSIDLRTGKSNMVSYGLNLWYCSRCANLVGLNR